MKTKVVKRVRSEEERQELLKDSKNQILLEAFKEAKEKEEKSNSKESKK